MVEVHWKYNIVVPSKDVLHLSCLSVDHVAGAVIAPCDAPISASVERHIRQRQDVGSVAFVQIELLLNWFAEFSLQFSQSLLQGTERVLGVANTSAKRTSHQRFLLSRGGYVFLRRLS